MKILAPSILSADFSNLSQQIRSVEIGGADWIHCDIMDGQFVPNITFGPLVVKAVNGLTKIPLDVHLMINNAENYFEDFINAGADYLTIHQEAVPHLDRQINRIHELGVKAGVSINPSTPVSTLREILGIVDMVLIMSVNPGFGGQNFIKNTIEKIKLLNDIRSKNNYNYLIEVDGGLDKTNIQSVMDSGCDVFVIGSSIYKSDNITAATVEFKNLLNNHK